jgi:ABC-type multidrug transport system fused ATPase/permease subunit
VTDGIPVIATVLVSLFNRVYIFTLTLENFAFQTFCLYPYFEEKPMAASKVFTVLAIFNIFTLPLFIITFVINTVSHAVVSTNRLHRFLAAPEVEQKKVPAEQVD